MNSIIIRTNSKNVLEVTLKELLEHIKDFNNYYWKLLWLDGIGDIGETIAQIRNSINFSESGRLTNYNELTQMSEKMTQMFDVVLLGDENLNKLIRYKDDNAMYKNCYHVIELVDTSYWKITSHDFQLLLSIKRKMSKDTNFAIEIINNVSN